MGYETGVIVLLVLLLGVALLILDGIRQISRRTEKLNERLQVFWEEYISKGGRR